MTSTAQFSLFLVAKHFALAVALAVALALCSAGWAWGQTPSTPLSTATSPASVLNYPITHQVDQVDVLHGTPIKDPYRWLEDDNAADTLAWVKAQNAISAPFFAAIPQRAPIHRLVTQLLNHERFGVPFKAGGRYFWTRNDGLQQQAVLFTATALTATPQVALDPNSLSKDGTVALTGTVPSRDGRMLAYGVAKGGSDWQTWRVRDLASGQDLPDVVDWVKFSSATWTADGKGFFYSRFDAPAPGTALSGANQFHKVYYRRLGTAQAADALVAQNVERKEWLFGHTVSDDGRWLILSVFNGTPGRNGLLALPLPGGRYEGGTPQPVSIDFTAQQVPIAVLDDQLIVRGNRGAPLGSLQVISLKDNASGWTVLVPPTSDTLVQAEAVGGRFVLRYLRDASTLLRLHQQDGTLAQELKLPGVGSASAGGGRWDDEETFLSWTSLITPADIYRLDVKTGDLSLFKRPKTAFQSDQFETRRAFVQSRDGTRFPVFIGHKKGIVLDGQQPTLMTGYGGFNVSNTPGYSVTAAAWMAMGGVYVSASIRGGGEYGRAWHEAGTKLNKQNVFDDFIAAAQWLVEQKITQPSKLAIWGGSNGGLLVAAVVNQRPDLFGAAIPAVGVLDMLRFHKFTIGSAWVGDYGSADDAQQFKALLAYSPLHNIRAGQTYPPILVMTADHDDRVVPAHSFKYTAALQAADTGPAPKLIRIESNAGHGAGKPTSKIIDERADLLAFIASTFKMQLTASPP